MTSLSGQKICCCAKHDTSQMRSFVRTAAKEVLLLSAASAWLSNANANSAASPLLTVGTIPLFHNGLSPPLARGVSSTLAIEAIWSYLAVAPSTRIILYFDNKGQRSSRSLLPTTFQWKLFVLSNISKTLSDCL